MADRKKSAAEKAAEEANVNGTMFEPGSMDVLLVPSDHRAVAPQDYIDMLLRMRPGFEDQNIEDA